MTFRARITIALTAVALIPLLVFGYGVRREMTSRLETESARRVAAASDAIGAELSQTVAADRARLRSLASDLAADNRFRIAIANPNSSERRWLLDWAPVSMQLGGFSMLQLQDSTGRILSSGQFRNDYDREDPDLPSALLAWPGGLGVVDARTPDGSVRTLAVVDTFTVAGRAFTLVGGRAFDSTRVQQLSTDATVGVRLVIGDSARAPAPQPDPDRAASFLYFRDAGGATPGVAGLMLVRDPGPERALREGINRWLLVTLGGTLAAALLVATLLAGRISAPIAELADKTARLDLDKLNQKFATDRSDEVGTLSRVLDAMTARMRTGAARLRDAERSAATGDLARQVNHDIKNGLAPIRNVLRHLSQTAEQEPEKLASIYAERRGTLESSVDYLDELSRNYARLSPALNRGTSDARAVVMEVAGGVSAVKVGVDVPAVLPLVRADAVVLRRILDNLVSNAVDSLDGEAGTVSLGAQVVGEGVDRRVRFTVADTGRGMTRQQLDRAFDDFYTTKPTGTGLGLSVVRRLLTDLGGSIKVETAPGKGSTFTVEIPAG
jgi:signal transduction histidine kinase